MMKKEQVILVADDDPGILEVVKIILTDSGYKVVTEENPANIIQRIKEFRPKLILMDLWMSGMDGHEVTVLLKKRAAIAHIPIIIISALNEGEKLAKEAGADDFLAKPFDISDLLAIVEKHLKSSLKS